MLPLIIRIISNLPCHCVCLCPSHLPTGGAHATSPSPISGAVALVASVQPELVSAISQAILNALRAADASSEDKGLTGRLLRDAVEAADAVQWPSGGFDEEAFEFVLNGLADGHLRLEARATGLSVFFAARACGL